MLLDVKGQVTPSCSQTHITYVFHRKESTGKLLIRFTYAPKILEDEERSRAYILQSIDTYIAPGHREHARDKWKSYQPLKNLITLSVDDPERHRGAGHRHDPAQLLHLSEQDASPGLVSGIGIAGLWKVTLSLHAIVTETCSYELQIWEAEEEN